ncbi:MAG: hypothetical protein K0Q55_1905 [Verrucomicrobia bacterium]|nr:hypothetical protein [Verrucomicrobiota bacterium]
MLLAAFTAVSAQGAEHDDHETYRANEFSMDLFGTASIGKYTIDHLSGSRVRHNSTLGAGVGMSYFVNRTLGFGADAYSENKKGALVDNASMNVIMRFPLGDSGFAPNIFGGGGYQFDTAKAWFAQAGAGLEYRFTQNVGIFTDFRFVLPDETKYYGVARLGMRFAF